MNILINDKWCVQSDTYGNYTPHKFVIIKEGVVLNTGKVSKADERWVSEQHYFPTLGQALGYIARKDVDGDFSSIQEYVEKKEQIFKELVQQVKVLNL